MTHWVRQYVGKPWAPDADGPARFSCWGLVRHVFRTQHGIEFPVVAVADPTAENVSAIRRAVRVSGMRPIRDAKPEDGDIVVMYRRGSAPPHCGIVVNDRGRIKVLHAAHERGVVCELWRDAVEGLVPEIWRRSANAADVLALDVEPKDRDTLRGVIQLSVAVATAAQPWYVAIGAQIFTALTLNELLPASQQASPDLRAAASPQQTGDSYSTSLAGNVARLDQPIWKICGRKEITPPLACQSYLEYLPRVDDSGESPSDFDPDLDREQYIYALYAVGIGNHNIVTAKIGNTPISRFADVLVAQYLPPGVQPTTVQANVTTASEVSTQILETGRYVGGYAACAAKRTAQYIGIDVVATRGLGKGGDPLTVEWRVEWRAINDFGQVLGAWTVLETETRTAYTATPQRWSNKYELPDAARVEVRVVRTDIQDTDPSALHEIAWTGLRAYLAESAPLNEHTAHYELVMRASSQLSANASRDLRLIVEALSRILNADLEWQAEEHHRNGSWWCLDLATSSTWGSNKPDSRVDLQSFYDLAQTADARQDRFDYVFDSSMSAWDAMQLIARSCRARVFRRNDVISIARDELAQIPVTAFTPRNCQAGMVITETLRNRKSPDGVIVEYEDYRTNEWTQIECPMPGVESDGMQRPVRLRLPGITGPTQAEREGLYEAASMLYRTRVTQNVTEMQGLLPAYMSPVDFLPDIHGYGSSGDVALWDSSTLTMTLTEKPDWTQAPLFLTLIRDDGSCHEPLEVEPGDTPFEVVLPEAPDFELVLDDGTRERPKYLIGRKELVKVSAIADGGKTEDGAQLYSIRGVIDDERVHTVDEHLLPESDEIQDEPLNPNDPDPGGGTDAIANLSERTITAATIDDGGGGTLDNLYAEVEFGNDGILRGNRGSDAGPIGVESEYANEWVLGGEIDPLVAAQFEIRFDVVGTVDAYGTGAVSGATLATWLSLGTARTVRWSIVDAYTNLDVGSDAYVVVRCQIRDAVTDIVQADKSITLRLRRNS